MSFLWSHLFSIVVQSGDASPIDQTQIAVNCKSWTPVFTLGECLECDPVTHLLRIGNPVFVLVVSHQIGCQCLKTVINFSLIHLDGYLDTMLRNFCQEWEKFSTTHALVVFFPRPFNKNFKLLNTLYEFFRSFYTQKCSCVRNDCDIVWLGSEKQRRN